MTHEIYRNSTQSVYLDIYGDTADATPTVTISNETEEIVVPSRDSVVGEDPERWVVTVGFAHTQSIGEIKVTWDFTIDGTPAQKVDYFDVVAPLASVSEIRSTMPGIPASVSDDDLMGVESRVRAFIESYTGQSFDPKHEVLLVKSESPEILLPKRLISLHSDSPILNYPYRIDNDGWVLNLLTPTYFEYGGVITSPPPISFDIKRDAYEVASAKPRRYKSKKTIQIDGIWGYERIPNPVKEAAYLLIQDFLSPDSIYRDKYLTSMTAADWRIQFHSGAWRGTGNARVDQLLSDYVVRDRWVIV